MTLPTAVNLKAVDTNFIVGVGDSHEWTWTFENPVTAAEWVMTITHDGNTVTWGLVQGGADELVVTLTRTQAATIGAGCWRWRLRHISGEVQRTRGGSWTVK